MQVSEFLQENVTFLSHSDIVRKYNDCNIALLSLAAAPRLCRGGNSDASWQAAASVALAAKVMTKANR